VYDYAGRQLGKAIGEKIGATLAAGVYFLRATGSDEAPVRIVKTR
jgi:hypothetical protein